MASFQTKADIDPQNNPSKVVLYRNSRDAGTQLPIDTMILLNGEKVIAESKILDGVAVFERISRKPFEINFECTFRQQNSEVNTALPNQSKYVFPQIKIEEFMSNSWNPNQVLVVQNTFLNGIGINEIIIKSVNYNTIRGSTNVACSIKCYENYNDNQGGTLVIPL